MLHPTWLTKDELLRSCEIRFKRASGPGGQNRNKVETGVVLLHTPTGVRAEATERRAQAENKEVAIGRLRIQLALDIRSPESEEFGSKLALYKSKSGRLAISASNWDWPIVLAELMNKLAKASWDVAMVAASIESTTSQVLKLLKQTPQAFQRLNHERKGLGLSVYKA